MRSLGHGTAEVKPEPDGGWYRWRVWYFPPGKTETTKYTRHHSRRKAVARAEAYANAEYTSHEGPQSNFSVTG